MGDEKIMRIAVCDDDCQERGEILDALHRWDPTRQIEFFVDGKTLLEASKSKPQFTIVFLDIYLPTENGIDIAIELRRSSPQTEIVFTTTSREFGAEAFSLKALHYLVKPITTEKIKEAFSRLQEKQRQMRPTLAVKVGYDMHLLYLEDIYSLESSGHKTRIRKKNNQVIEVYEPLRNFTEKLKGRFLLIQRGLCVNMDSIEKMSTDSCTLRDGTVVLLSRATRIALREQYDNYIFNKMSMQFL